MNRDFISRFKAVKAIHKRLTEVCETGYQNHSFDYAYCRGLEDAMNIVTRLPKAKLSAENTKLHAEAQIWTP